ncbi:hypothetical protein NDO71_orf079 [Klebsiella phage vB_KpnM_NDO71]|nr:hypothetical protein NDO71_orf079 [Klebsiella phage vB_KpnM_NDO71]
MGSSPTASTKQFLVRLIGIVTRSRHVAMQVRILYGEPMQGRRFVNREVPPDLKNTPELTVRLNT